MSYLKTVYEHYADEARKKPPYDKTVSSVSFHDDALIIQLVKKGEVVFEDKIPRSELEGK